MRIATSVRDDSKTSSTLLVRLALSPPDQASWNEFVDRYGPSIFQWCSARGLQEADALDVSQGVLSKLAVELRHFRYDPARGFRRWLRTLVRNAAHDALMARARNLKGGAPPGGEVLESLEAREDLVHRLAEEFDLELLDMATRAVRARIALKTWEAYHLTASEGRPASEAAARLGMRIGAVYQARSSVTRLLQEEVRKLEGDFLPHEEGD